MNQTIINGSKRFWIYTASVICLAAVVLFYSHAPSTAQKTGATAPETPSAVFTNSTPIPIDDAAPSSLYPSTIAVSGLSGTITSVKVTINGYNHTFPDDMGMVLVGPTGAALLIQDGAGDDPDMVDVTYTLVDGSPALPSATAWTAGNYKATTYYTGDSFPPPGPGTTYGSPGPTGGGTATFASQFNGTAPNGNWNLYVADFVGGDEGEISGGWSIEITTDAPTSQQHMIDYDGNGRTDFSVVRNTGGGPTGAVTWFNQLNGGAGTHNQNVWGSATDFFVPGNYDADNLTDLAVWRPGPPFGSFFYILQSTTNTIRIEQFGQSGDDPTIVGDYNGDGLDDPATYRAGAASGDVSFWYWRQAVAGPIFVVPWGQNGDFPAPGDYDGNGSNDCVIQRNNGGGQAIFWTRLSTTGAISSTIFGTPTDVIVPGDYDGDGKTDIAVVRGIGGQINWFVLPSSGGTFTTSVFGLSATDFTAQGDYDGDGKTDVAVWRPNADPTQNFFYTLGSTAGFSQFEWGQNGDFPVANYNHH